MRWKVILRLYSGASVVAVLVGATAALAQQPLPTIDIGGGRTHPHVGPVSRGTGQGTASAPAPAPIVEPAASLNRAASANAPVDPMKGYARSVSWSATKTSTPLINTPQSVQIIPREVIEDKQALTTMEAVKNVSGIQAAGGTYYDQFLIRGFNSGYGLNYRNGLRIEGTNGGVETAFTDRIEVVKGPASMLFGRIEPGGFVNVVTKRPQEEFSAVVTQQVGSWGLARTVADVTGAANKEKSILYRVMGVYDHADSWVNFDHRDNGAAAAYFTFRPTNDFEFNLQFEHYQKKQTHYSGSGTIPVDPTTNRLLNLSRSFSASDPAFWSNFPVTIRRTTYAFDWAYSLTDKWTLRNRFHYIDIDENQNEIGSFGFDGVSILRGFWNQHVPRGILSTNLDLTGEIVTGPFTHRLLGGLDYYRYQDDWLAASGFAGPQPPLYPGPGLYPLNVYAPFYGGVTGLQEYASYARNNVLWRSRWNNFGVYAQDQISFWDDRIQLLLGGRWDKAEESYAKVYGGDFEPCYPFCNPGMNRYPDNTPLSPRAGLLVKLDPDTSVYGSYVRSSGTNNSSFGAEGERIAPEQGLQWEAGAKKFWLDGALWTSVALFDLRKKNVLQPDPIFPGRSIAVGEVTSRGVEFDISGQVTPNLSVIASYTFDSVKITNDNNNGNVGKRYYSAAPSVGNIWAKWDTAPGAAEGFEFGGGLYAMASRYGDNANTWVMPGYVKLDAMAAYRTQLFGHGLKLQLNVKNLTDKRYFDFTNGGQFAYYGAPRTFLGQVSFSW